MRERVPIEIPEPGVLPYLLEPMLPKPVHRFSLNHSVNKIRALLRPAPRQIFFFYLNLLGEDVVADLLPRLADVRPLRKDENKRDG